MANIGQSLLLLDDNPYRLQLARKLWPACTLVKTAAECIRLLKLREWSTVSLDHDLNGEEYVNSDRADCGMEVVRWIVANKPRVDSFLIHSHNDGAAFEMLHALRTAGYKAYRKRFGEGELWTPKSK